MSWVGCGHHAVNFHRAPVTDRDLRASRYVAAVAHVLAEAAIDTLRRRLAPSRPFCNRVEDRKVLGMVCHQLATELERILAGGMGELVHEAFEVDGILIVVHTTPKVRRDMRVAHG